MNVFTRIRVRLAYVLAPAHVRVAMHIGMELLAVKVTAQRLVDADEREDISGVDQELAVLRDLGFHALPGPEEVDRFGDDADHAYDLLKDKDLDQ